MSEASRLRVALPETIPIFPLAGALLLPRGQLPLNIFEPRYLNMIDDALRGDRLIGMVQSRSSRNMGQSDVFSVGCVGRIASFSETDDGRYLITLLGVSRFKVLEELDASTPYRQARVDWSPYSAVDTSTNEPLLVARRRLLDLLKQYLALEGLAADWTSIEKAGHETLVNSLAMICPFTPDEKQALIEAKTLDDRAAALTALMEMAIAEQGGDQDEENGAKPH
ncbi:MAG: LON peptidase substrate-binding domain-containing protein [Pseudomonadota bacterium]